MIILLDNKYTNNKIQTIKSNYKIQITRNKQISMTNNQITKKTRYKQIV